jgi:hypothetical protein
MDHRPGLLERVTGLLQRPGGGQIVGFCHSHRVSLCVTTSHGPGRTANDVVATTTRTGRHRCHNDAVRRRDDLTQ